MNILTFKPRLARFPSRTFGSDSLRIAARVFWGAIAVVSGAVLTAILLGICMPVPWLKVAH